MESVDNKGETKRPENRFNKEIHSKIIRAGKRTYFFDVKSTRNDEYYLTITESKKRYTDNGKFQYEKHKLFLYSEDFEKFADSLEDVIHYIRNNQPGRKPENQQVEKPADFKEEVISVEDKPVSDYSDLDFEDI